MWQRHVDLAADALEKKRIKEAESHFLQALAKAPDSVTRCVILSSLAIVSECLGKGDQASAQIKEAVDELESQLAMNPADDRVREGLNQCVANSITVLDRKGLTSDAIAAAAKHLERQRAHLGVNHPFLAPWLDRLAQLYATEGRYALAVPLVVELLKIHKTALPKDHPILAVELNRLADLLLRQRKFKDAEPVLVKAKKILENGGKLQSTTGATILNNLCNAYRMQGKIDAAQTTRAELLKLRKSVALPFDLPDAREGID